MIDITCTARNWDAELFVVCKDTWLSGWGHAEGKNSLIVLPCRNQSEANVVIRNAQNRTDMDEIKIYTELPEFKWRDLVHVADRDDYQRWYVVGGFQRPNPYAKHTILALPVGAVRNSKDWLVLVHAFCGIDTIPRRENGN